MERRIEKARKQVADRVGQHREIAKALGVSYSWVRRFVAGTLVEPGAVKFARLEAWLAEN